MTRYRNCLRTRLERLFAVLGVLVAVTLAPDGAHAEWGMSVFGGMTASGTLYTAKNDGVTRRWEIPGGNTSFEGVEVRADVSEFGAAGLRIVGEFEERWGTHLSVSLSDLDVRSLVRTVANNVSETDWDQLFVANLQAVATYDLVVDGNTPYLLAGLGLTSLSSEGDSLDQTTPALVWGAGFKIRAIEGMQIDIDARDSVVWPNYDDEKTRLAAAEFKGGGALHVWEITLGWTYMFR